MKRTALLVFMALFLAAGQAMALTLDDAVQAALENNPKISRYAARRDAAASGVDAARAPFWPMLDAGYAYSHVDPGTVLSPADSSVFEASLSYNLFAGFKNRADLSAARYGLDAALQELDAARQDVALSAKAAFLNILRARKNRDVAKEAVSLLERQQEDTTHFFEVKLVARNEVLKVDVELASARQSLTEAKSALRLAREEFWRVTGIRLEPDGDLEDPGKAPEIDKTAQDLSPLLEKRSELQYLTALRQASDQRARSIRAGYWPSLDAALTYDSYGDNAWPQGLDSAYQAEDEAAATLSATWRLFDGFEKKHRIAAIQAESRALKETLRETRDQMELQLTQALEDYTVYSENLKVAEAAITQAEENYRITDDQFKAQLATARDLLDARYALTRAQNQLVNAFYDLHLAVARIERVTQTPASELQGQ